MDIGGDTPAPMLIFAASIEALPQRRPRHDRDDGSADGEAGEGRDHGRPQNRSMPAWYSGITST